jgi:hypothetical protein
VSYRGTGSSVACWHKSVFLFISWCVIVVSTSRKSLNLSLQNIILFQRWREILIARLLAPLCATTRHCLNTNDWCFAKLIFFLRVNLISVYAKILTFCKSNSSTYLLSGICYAFDAHF